MVSSIYFIRTTDPADYRYLKSLGRMSLIKEQAHLFPSLDIATHVGMCHAYFYNCQLEVVCYYTISTEYVARTLQPSSKYTADAAS